MCQNIFFFTGWYFLVSSHCAFSSLHDCCLLRICYEKELKKKKKGLSLLFFKIVRSQYNQIPSIFLLISKLNSSSMEW